jgi:histone acetyltransferase
MEERQHLIEFNMVTFDSHPRSTIILNGLKVIHQVQLPKMPKEYITKLVFDRNHHSMAIVKRGLRVIGGITFRLFKKRGFAEIVFCAISGKEQIKVLRLFPARRIHLPFLFRVTEHTL